MGLNPEPYVNIMGVGRIGIKVTQLVQTTDYVDNINMKRDEVICFGQNSYDAYLKVLMGAGIILPINNVFLSIAKESLQDKLILLETVKTLQDLGLSLYASHDSVNYYSEHDIITELKKMFSLF